ncbi:hypothetical protein [Sphingobium sp. BS19]|uniref:hypothetical protein n=1 Tax=Sphingobium sp. BS19 TaxID=3018973 RepID=UPI0022ED8B39|nr:hypothetical protein [Sphingobium sp. BS19]GLI99164.1 hypothetical protein Sbs19_29820 [Sphingobium sp. BS19]
MHYFNGFVPDRECDACNGHGEVCGVNPNHRSRFVGYDDLSPGDFTVECQACAGTGYVPMTQEEIDDAAADAFSDMCEGEPPMTMNERHQLAWAQKQELHK